MNNRTVAHEWANQTRESRRGSNFFFEGPALYSYGRHFIVGLIVPGDTKKRKGKIALLNSASYSNSTSTHQNAARAAAPELLAALEMLISNYDNGGQPRMMEVIPAARAAIAKARGQ